jgi:hypothetical protein
LLRERRQEQELTLTALSGTLNLNIDSIGNAAIKQCDGSTNPASGDIAVGRQIRLTYDGTVFRLPCNPATVTSGGATISKTAFASLPGTCTSGNLYLFSDSTAAENALCGTSNTYSYFRDGIEITLPPSSGSFTAVTTGASGTAAISTANGGLTITAGSNSGNAVSNAYVKALANGTTFTLTVALQLSFSNSTYPVLHFGLTNGTGATDDEQAWLLGGTDNSGTASGDSVANFTDWGSTSFVSDVDLDIQSGLKWRRIRHASGTRYYEKSSDGINWTVFYSTTTTTHITPTHYYFRLSGRGAATVVHLKEE